MTRTGGGILEGAFICIWFPWVYKPSRIFCRRVLRKPGGWLSYYLLLQIIYLQLPSACSIMKQELETRAEAVWTALWSCLFP